MDDEARTTLDIIWSSPDRKLSDGNLLENVRRSIESLNSVISAEAFLISDQRAVVRVTTTVSLDLLVDEIDPIFGSEFELHLQPGEDSTRVRFSVFPRTNNPIAAEVTRGSSISSVRTPRTWLPTRWPAVAMVSLTLALTLLTFLAESPPGIDTPGHLFKAWAIARQAESDFFSPLMWTQDWYQGHPLFYYYPPASYFAIGSIDFVVDNIVISYRIFLFISILLGAGVTYALGRTWLTPLYSTLGAFFYVLAPYPMKMIFWEGNLPRTATFALLPLVVLLTIRLVDSGGRRYFVLLALSVVSLVLFHHMPAVPCWACWRYLFRSTPLGEFRSGDWEWAQPASL